ncbi:MAG: hypothetical protein AAF193_07085, partial [Bacteroidota bacterium]
RPSHQPHTHLPPRTVSARVNLNVPNAEAPQAILLVVPPGDSRPWNCNDIAYSIQETIDMAKYRGLRTEDLMKDPDLGKILNGLTMETEDHSGNFNSTAVEDHFSKHMNAPLNLIDNNDEIN